MLLFGCMFFCNESPRFLAKQDRWEQAHKTLAKVRHLPMDHPYVQAEYGEMVTQLENERQLIGGSSFKDLMREMWTIPGNRKRALISITLMICQQMVGRFQTPCLFDLRFFEDLFRLLVPRTFPSCTNPSSDKT